MKNANKFTPGPWVVHKLKRPSNSLVLGFGQVDSNKWVGRISENLDTDFDTDLANARLIAAAPEMLEAIDALTVRLTDLNSQGRLNGLKLDLLIKQAFDVITKATGGAE